MTVGKGLTGAGMLPMSATLVSGPIYDSFRARGEQKRTFFTATPFAAIPLPARRRSPHCRFMKKSCQRSIPQRVAELEQGMKITFVLECALAHSA